MKRWLSIISFLACASSVLAQSGDSPGGAASGMGGTALAINNVWGFYQNQAGLAEVETVQSGVFYENRFLISELGFQGLAAAMPIGKGVLGVGFHSFGYTQFRESQYGLAYAMKLSEELNVGIGFDYSNMRIGEGYGSSSSFIVQGGFQYSLNDKVLLAGHVFNPNRAKRNDYADERIPTLLKGGLGYAVSSNVHLYAEVVKDVDYDASARLGMSYWVNDQFVLRAGVGTEPVETSFGFGLRLSNFQIDLASSYDNILGFSPSIAVTFNGSKF